MLAHEKRKYPSPNSPKEVPAIAAIPVSFKSLFWKSKELKFNFDIFGYEPGMNGLRYQGPFGEEWISGSYLKNFGIIVIINLFLNPNKIYRNYYFLILIIILFLAILATSITFGVAILLVNL